ncbi:MAG: hypothetical protein J0M28_13190 [Thauera sp.]|nr:hypothetical protein [Thauera sp.]
MSNHLNIAIEHDVDDLPLWHDPDAYAVVIRHLGEHHVAEDQLARLVAAYREHAHKQRRRGLTEDIDDILMASPE